MKNLTIAAAVAAATMISSGAHAFTISSNITAVQMFVGTYDMVVPCSSPTTGLAIGGTATTVGGANSGSAATASSATMSGEVCLNPGIGAPLVRLTFALTDGTYTRMDNPGVTFTDGTVGIEVDVGSGWIPYGALDASVTNIPCLAHSVGHLGSTTPPFVANNMTYGLWLAEGTWPLPGLWHPTTNGDPDDGINDAVCAIDLQSVFGVSAGMYLKGTITVN